MPNSRAIGAVTKLLVAVTSARTSPRLALDQRSRRLPNDGRILRTMKLLVPRLEHRSRMSGERPSWKSRNSWMSSVPALY